MSELFENLELQMREEAEAKNPRSAILASQMESEKRFSSFISSNVGRITVIENELKEIAYKYASQYDVDPQMVFEAVAESLIKNAADENDEDQTEEILKFWESVSPEMAEKYRKKITPPKMKNEKGEIVDATDEALTQRSENFAKKNMEHDPNAVLEGVDREMKSRGYDKCFNCGSHAGVSNYGDEAGDFCSPECGMEYLKKREGSSKTAEWEPNIEEENIEQLDLLGEILDAENAGDFDTVASLSRQYKQQYGPITREMMEKARNRDFGVRELDEDFGPGVRGNDLGDNFDDREASVKRAETEREQNRKAAFQEIMNAKKSGVPHDDILEMLKDYKADFNRNFSTDSQKKQASLEDLTNRQLANEYTGILRMLKEDPSLEEKFRTLIMGMERELKSRHIEDPNQYEDINVDLGGPMNSNDNLYDSKHQMSASFNREAALAAFIEANQDVLFPEWMIREAGGKSWKGMGVKDVLDLSNLYGTKFYDKLGPQEEEEDATDPEAAVNAQQGVQGLVPGGEVAADEQPTIEQPAVKKNLLQQKYEDAQEKINPSEEEWAAMQRSFADERARQKAIQDAKNEKEQSLREYWENVAQGGPSQMGGRGKYRDEYLRGANVKTASLEQQLVNFYINVGIEPKTAAIFVQSVGEMAQLQQSNPGLPIAAPDPETMDINKEIGGKEGDKYQNWDVSDKDKALGLDRQEFTDFGEPTREFIQPGGEAPYSENTSDKIDQGAESVDMGASNVTQADNAPKQSNFDSDVQWQEFYNKRYPELLEEGYDEEEAKELAEEYADYKMEKGQSYHDDYYMDHPHPRESRVKTADAFEDMMDFKRNEERDYGNDNEWDWIYQRPQSGPAFFPGEMEDDDWSGAELVMDKHVNRQAQEYHNLAKKIYEYMHNPNRDPNGPSDDELKELINEYMNESLEMDRRLNAQNARQKQQEI